MDPTIPADNIGGSKYQGCAIVSLLSPLAQHRVGELQANLGHELGDALWMMPAASLHITLCEIIQPKAYSQDTATMFRTRRQEYEAVLNNVLSKYGPIRIVFNRIEASQHAIVVRGDDDGIFNKIRAELIKELPLPAKTKLPPDVVHSSIARYVKEVELATIQRVVSHQSILFEEVISEFQFMYPIQPHLLHFDVVRRYSLER